MSKTKLKIGLFIFVSLTVTLFFTMGYDQYLTLSFIKEQRATFQAYCQQNMLAAIGGFMLVYIFVTALSLPGAAVMTLAAGALFGLVTGTVIVSFASTIGATLAFGFARFVFYDTIQNTYAKRLKTINEGFKREGGFYLFTLRLVPVFPFFVVNLLMGLTPIGWVKYFVISQIGMLPGTIAYIYAGEQLATLESASGILSFDILVAFTALGVLPLLLKKLVDFTKRQKILAPFDKPKKADYNMVVIGAGSGGLVASYIAAAVKAKVALIEKHKMGGDCLNTGCVPSKAFIRSAKLAYDMTHADKFGFKKPDIKFEFADIMARVKNIIKTIAPHDSVERYTKLGVDCFTDKAEIIDPYRVKINGQTLTTRNIVIATGAGPLVPPIKGLENASYVTSDTLWDLKTLPENLAVLGGGPIGCELAQAFARLGSNVTIIEMAGSLLVREDQDVASFITKKFKSDGITVCTEHKAARFEKDAKGERIICEHNGQETAIEFDTVLLALGRKANTNGFGLDKLGVELAQNNTIKADAFMRTNFPNIFVCGDVTGPYQFTHIAAHQAWYATVNALFAPFKTFRVDNSVIPYATFTDPEIATVGINERTAKERGTDYQTTIYPIADLDRAITESANEGFVKVLTVPGKDKILGATIVAPHAGELITEFITAIKHNHGLNDVLGTIHIYPTMAESNKFAAGQWKKAHAPEGLLEWVKKFHNWRRG